jgi:hypothetical protein
VLSRGVPSRQDFRFVDLSRVAAFGYDSIAGGTLSAIRVVRVSRRG